MRVLARQASFLDRLKVAWSLIVHKGGGDVPMTVAFNDILRYMRTGALREPYVAHAWVYACIRTIAQNISQVPWRIVSGDEERPRPVNEANPLSVLFTQPNPNASRYQFWEAILTYLETRGSCMIYMPGRPNIAAIPTSMIPEDPNIWEIDIDHNTGWPLGWIRTVRGQRTFVPLHQVLFFRYFHPTNPWKGLAPLDAARMGVDQDYWAAQYNTAFFENGAMPGGLLIFPDTLTDESYDRMKLQWEERHQGSQNAFKVAILEGGAEYKQTILTHHDMEFLEQKKWNRQEICSCFGVPPEIIGFGKDTYQNVHQSRRLFWSDTLLTKMRYVEDFFYAAFFKYLGTGDLWGHFDTVNVEALQEDYKEKVNTGYKLWQMGVPLNAINKRLVLGLPNVPWGDAAWLPINLQPVDDTPDPDDYTDDGGNGNGNSEEEDDDKKSLGNGNGHDKKVLPLVRHMLEAPSAQQRSLTSEYFVKVLTPLERQMQQKVKRFLFRQRKDVLTKFFQLAGAHALGLNKQFDEADLEELFLLFNNENTRLRAMAKPLHALGLDTGAVMLYEELGIEPALQLLSDPVANFIRSRGVLVEGINDTIRSGLRGTLLEGMTAGESVEQLAQRIRDTYNFAQSRSLAIARTEMSSAVNAGRYFVMQTENVEGSRWMTAADEKVRPSHRSCDGVVRLLGDRFPNGLHYPGDPQGGAAEVVNCRCYTIPIIKVDTTGDEPVPA